MQLYVYELKLITLNNRLQTLFRLRERAVGGIASANHSCYIMSSHSRLHVNLCVESFEICDELVLITQQLTPQLCLSPLENTIDQSVMTSQACDPNNQDTSLPEDKGAAPNIP
ncbi:unnamed protein product [Leuciscus chuanchicus]